MHYLHNAAILALLSTTILAADYHSSPIKLEKRQPGGVRRTHFLLNQMFKTDLVS